METSASYVIHDAGRSDLTGKSIRCSPRYQRPSPRLKRASVTSILSFCNQKLIGFAFFFSFLLSCICSPVSSVPPPPPGHTAKDDKVESAIFQRSLRPARHCTSKLVSELSHWHTHTQNFTQQGTTSQEYIIYFSIIRSPRHVLSPESQSRATLKREICWWWNNLDGAVLKRPWLTLNQFRRIRLPEGTSSHKLQLSRCSTYRANKTDTDT